MRFYPDTDVNGRITMKPGVGTLIFARAIARLDQGRYECAAINSLGVALSDRVNVGMACKLSFVPTVLLNVFYSADKCSLYVSCEMQ